jgi:2-amino-4-hydroxy-6-hydroxymethyldihydropteridine diphosphokinase
MTGKSVHHQTYIALGTNIGDRERNLQAATNLLTASVAILKKSAIYETPPWGILDQPAFLNQVILGSTMLSPHRLLAYLKGIEEKMGREKTIRFGPRIIDLDILIYDNVQLKRTHLTIPHPRMCERAFVLLPLFELAPDLVIPGTSRTVTQWLETVDQSGIMKLP